MSYERLLKCIPAGSAAGLFRLLKDWTKPELKAVLDEVDEYDKAFNSAVHKSYAEIAMRPENFLNRRRSKEIDEALHEVDLNNFAMLSEISSVALYYLDRQGNS